MSKRKAETINKTYKKKNKSYKAERPISSKYPVIDTDLGRDNIENDLSYSDLQDL